MKVTRRTFLIGTGIAVGGSLVVGISLRRQPPVPGLRPGSFQPDALLQITPDNEVIFQMARAEMGQGAYDGTTTIIAEELDVDPARITVEFAGVHPEFALVMGQITGGSMSMASAWDPYRQTGAKARAMLIDAAARRWGISRDQISTDNGVVISPTGERLTYGALVEHARQVSDNVEYELKNPAQYRWIGKEAPRLDSYIKSTGQARFGIDVDLPGIRTAVVVRPPQFGSRVKSWNADAARASAGVDSVLEIHTGIAIVAAGYWEARKAAASLRVEWEEGPLAGLSSDAISNAHRQALKDGEPRIMADHGDLEAALSAPARVVEAEYAAGFMPHNTMEPQNATALFDGGRLEVWAPSQGPDLVQAVVAHFTGLDRQDITVHSTFLGGGFGRRGYVDFAGEAAVIAQRLPGIPVKVIWSREEDIKHDYYRPASVHAVKAALDDSGNLKAWQHTVVSSSIVHGIAPDMASALIPAFVPVAMARSLGRYAGNFLADRDPTVSEGAEIPYAVPNLQVSQILSEHGIPVGFWRSVGSSHTAFASESFMDEMAAAAGTDPVAFRRRHLQDKPRHLAVLEMAAEKAGWGTPRPGVYQGVAVHESFESCVGMVVEVSVAGTRYTVERVVAAIDCGRAVNPHIVRRQVQSGIIFGLSAAMLNPVTIENGGVKQSNFHDAPVLRITEAPEMEVHIVNSDAAPTGVGEPGVPPVAPALANALYAATGQRLRTLPLKLAQ